MKPVLIILLLSLASLSACTPDDPQGVLEDYADRVANVLDMDIDHDAFAPTLAPFPARRDRRQAVKELRVGLLDSLDFAQCDLLPLIVERNGSLGKVMLPSKVMSYELRFFARLAPCYQHLSATPNSAVSPEFSKLLTETYQVKRANLDAVVWNGIFTSKELEKQFSLSRPPIPLQGNPGYGDSLRALQKLQAIAATVTRYDETQNFQLPQGLDQLEQAYFSLNNSEYGSQLEHSLALLTQNLNQVADLINRKLDQRPLCFLNHSNPKADILFNVFRNYYAGKVQPYMAMVQQQGLPWLNTMNKLMDFSGQKRSAAVIEFQREMVNPEAKNSLWDNYQQAIHRHTKAWQRALKQCNLMPSVD